MPTKLQSDPVPLYPNRGTKQKQYLEQYENATNSFTLAEKNDFRNKWHENFFRGGLTDTVREIQKTDKP